MKQRIQRGVVLLGLAMAGGWLLWPSQEPTQASTPTVAQLPTGAGQAAGIPPPPNAVTTLPTSQPAIVQALAQLANCEQYHNCPQGKTDAYEGEYLRQQQMVGLLSQLTRMASQQPTDEAALRQVAAEYLAWPDGHVQSAALSLLSALPPQTGNVRLITVALQANFDAPLTRQALQELQRYPANDAELQNFFSQTLQTGSLYVAQEVAQGLLPFLTAENVGYYQHLLTTLDKQTTKAKLLQATLNEFSLQQSQG